MSGVSRALLVYLIVGMVLGSPWVEAAVWYVSATAGNNANAGTSAATPFKSLSHALTQPSLAPGDLIRVLQGTYDAANGETFPLPIKPGVSVVADTIVAATLPDGDPGAALRPRVLASGGMPAFKPDTTSNYDANTRIEGLLIRRDPADPSFADLINAEPTPPRFNPTIRNNRFESAANGAGIYIEADTGTNSEASPLIEDNAFSDLWYGVFAYANSATSITMNPVIQNNTFTTVDNDIYLSGFSGFDGEMSPLITGNTSTGGQQFITWSFAPGGSFDFAPTIASNSFTGDPTTSWGISGNVGIWQGAPRITPLIENNMISAANGLIELSAEVWEMSAGTPITTPEWTPTIRGNTLTSSNGSGISLYTSISDGSPTAAPLIDNNVITTAFYGIYQSGWMIGPGNPVMAPSATGNTITTGGDGIVLWMNSQSLSPGSVGTYTPTVTGNGINITNGGTGIQMYFEDIYSGSIVADLTVSNNVLTSNSACCGAGMWLSMSYFPTSGSANVGWTIANNSVSGFYYEGLFFEISEMSGDTNGLEGTIDVLVTGNTVTNNGFGGISLSISPYNFTGTQNILVQGNTITDNSGQGLVLSVSSQTDVTTNSIKVLDNVIDSNDGGGLYLWIEQWAPGGIPTNPTLVSGNTITNNAIGQPTTAFWGGVYVGDMPTPDFGGGNLASPGGNVISGNGPWDFINATSAIVKAESNEWGSTDPAAIDARIYDDNEDPLRGLVDFEPIAGAVVPVTCPTPINADVPSSGAQVEPSGLLSWSGGAGATEYKVYLGPAGSGCSTLFGMTTSSSMAFSGLTPGEYDWKVVAEKTGCTTPPESACVRFTVADPCPNQAPSLVTPEPNARVSPETRFEWTTVPDAIQYRLVIFTLGGGGFEELAAIPQPTAPLPPTIGFDATLPLGTVQWRVFADYADGCESISSRDQIVTVTRDCPSAAPVPIAPLENAPVGETPVLFQWSPVSKTVRYELHLSINGAPFQNVGMVPGTVDTPSIAVDIPAGASIAWYAEAFFEEGCGSARSRTVSVDVSCFPPVLSLQGEVTTDKPYEVRATIVSVGQDYLFEESDSETFGRILATKGGQIDPTGQFVFAMFEHSVTEPRAFYYRVRLNQTGCEFSGPGRIVVIPLPPPTSTDADTVVQFGNEEEVRQPLFIASPTPELQTSYTYIATTDRDWMRVEPAGGTIGQAGVTVTVVTNPVGLPVGTNTGTVTLTFTELAGSGKQALETTPVSGTKPVSVTLVTPVTNKGKGAPTAESLIIPAVAHATGVNSEWQTDVRILNLSAQKQKYRLFWTSTGTDATLSGKNSDVELAPGQSSALDDIVKQWYGLGSLPGEAATGVLEIRPLGPTGAGKGAAAVPVTRSLTSLASSRMYNKTPQGTLGEYIPAIPFASFVGGAPPPGSEKSVLSLQQLAQSSDYRTNIGVAEASGQPVSLEMRFYDGEGTKILTVPVSLRAGEHQQFNQILATHGLTNVTTARAEIEVVSGNGKIAAYASVVDNKTGDPLQVRAVDLATIGARKYVLPGIAHFDTGQARWRSDVQMFNAGLASVTATVSFFPVGSSAATKTATVEIAPGKMRTLGDIVPSLFGESNTGGAIQIATATNSELVVTGRTYDQRETGSYGQFMEAVTEDEAVGLGDRAVQVLQMEQSSNIRTNLGLVEVTGKPVRVEITAFPAESRVTPRLEFNLQPNEFRQLNEVLKTLNAGTTYNARVGVRVVGGDGKIVAYGSAVDNLTQDPTFIPGQ